MDTEFSARVARAREKLDLSKAAYVVYYAGQPHAENSVILSQVGAALAYLWQDGLDIVLVASRHEEDTSQRFPNSGEEYREVLQKIRDGKIRVIDNSEHHRRYPHGHPDAVLTAFRPLATASLEELLCLCADFGIIVIGDDDVHAHLRVLAYEMAALRVIYRGQDTLALVDQFRRACEEPLEYIFEDSDPDGIQADTPVPAQIERVRQ